MSKKRNTVINVVVYMGPILTKNGPKIWLPTRDHSFPRNVEFWAKPQNLPVSAEFLLFYGILRSLYTGWW